MLRLNLTPTTKYYIHAYPDQNIPDRLHIVTGYQDHVRPLDVAYAEALAVFAAIQLEVSPRLIPADWEKLYGSVFSAREEEEQGHTLHITPNTPASYGLKDGYALIALGANALKVPSGAALDGLINLLLSIRDEEASPAVNLTVGEWDRLYSLDGVGLGAGVDATDMTGEVMAWYDMSAFVPEEPAEEDWYGYGVLEGQPGEPTCCPMFLQASA